MPEIFRNVCWELQPDLEMFMEEYMSRITPDFVKLSIGLRATQIYEETAPLIMKIPQAFVSALIDYFQSMEQKGKLPHLDFESLTMVVFSIHLALPFLTLLLIINLQV